MDRKTLGEMIPPRHQSQAQDGFDASMIAQDKAKRIADIEARHAADDARRIRVLALGARCITSLVTHRLPSKKRRTGVHGLHES